MNFHDDLTVREREPDKKEVVHTVHLYILFVLYHNITQYKSELNLNV